MYECMVMLDASICMLRSNSQQNCARVGEQRMMGSERGAAGCRQEKKRKHDAVYALYKEKLRLYLSFPGCKYVMSLYVP